MIISDIAMPYMDGFRFLEEIRKQNAWPHMPFIFLTAHGESPDRRRGIELGADHYLTKPFSAEDLVVTVASSWKRHVDKFTSAEANHSVLDESTQAQTPPSRGLYKPNTDLFSNLQIGTETLFEPLQQEQIFLTHWDGSYEQIVSLKPDFLVFHQPTSQEMERWQKFELTRHIPKLVTLYPFAPYALPATFETALKLNADAVCVETPDEIAAALNTIKSLPVLTLSETLDVVLITQNEALADQIVSLLDKEYRLAVKRSVSDTDLILLDTEQPVTVSQLREQNINAPIILLGKEYQVEPLHELYQAGIYDYIVKPIDDEKIVKALFRLSRWPAAEPDLTELSGQAQYRMTALKFELHLIKTQPSLVAMMIEASAQNSGLIHDLRNSWGGLNALQRRTSGLIANFNQSLAYVRFMIEVVAEARFKASWNPKIQDIRPIMARVIQLVQCAPQPLTLELSAETQADVFADADQLVHAITCVFIACQAQGKVKASVTKKGMIFRFPVTTLPVSEDHNLHSLFFCIGDKLLERHQGSIQVIKGKATITLPVGGWPNEISQRRDIATFAEEADQIDTTLVKMRKSLTTHDVETAPLIMPLGQELVRALNQLWMLTTAEHTQIRYVLRYTALLARNLLMTSARVDSDIQPLAIRPLFEAIPQLLRSPLKDVKVIFEIAEATPPVLGDELAMLQILVNLATNASEAMKSRGELRLRAFPDGEYVQIEVSDQGYGISPENLSKIFELHFTTKSGHERGVGLHIVASLVEKLNGTLTVDSIINQGTTFIIRLPASIQDK